MEEDVDVFTVHITDHSELCAELGAVDSDDAHTLLFEPSAGCEHQVGTFTLLTQ